MGDFDDVHRLLRAFKAAKRKGLQWGPPKPAPPVTDDAWVVALSESDRVFLQSIGIARA